LSNQEEFGGVLNLLYSSSLSEKLCSANGINDEKGKKKEKRRQDKTNREILGCFPGALRIRQTVPFCEIVFDTLDFLFAKDAIDLEDKT